MSEKLIRFPIGVSDFKKLVTGNYCFIDKTLFVKDLMDDGAEVILLARPRRFGKTLSLSMLLHFLQLNQSQNLFENLALSKETEFCRQHQGQYPVIFVSFKDVKKSSYEDAYEDIALVMRNLYSEHRYLIEEELLKPDEKEIFEALLSRKADKTDVANAIKQLSSYLMRKFNKPAVILIDEYDTPIQEAYLKGYYSQMIDLMRSIFGQALKDNTCVAKAVITGITRVAQEGLFSGLNNLQVYTLLQEKYGQYFGFTEPEVINLLEAASNPLSIDMVREWYNGYRIGKHVAYNPWSILTCLSNNGKLEPYWLNTSSNDLIKELVAQADFKMRKQFELLLQGQTIEKPLMQNLVFMDLKTEEEAVWSLLLYAGYLNVLFSETRDFRLMAKVSVPNKEVMYIYDQMVAGWFRRGNSLDYYLEFIKSLVEGNLDIFKRHLAEYIMESGSFFDFNKNTPERVFHSFMLGLVVGLKKYYIIQSNQESGLGRFDVVFVPKDKRRAGILLEFKAADNAESLPSKAKEALQQIKDQQYITLFKQQEIASVLVIGLAFCGKQLEMTHEYLN